MLKLDSRVGGDIEASEHSTLLVYPNAESYIRSIQDPGATPTATDRAAGRSAGLAEMGRVYREMRMGTTPLDASTKLVYVLSTMRATLEAMAPERIERRLNDLQPRDGTIGYQGPRSIQSIARRNSRRGSAAEARAHHRRAHRWRVPRGSALPGYEFKWPGSGTGTLFSHIAIASLWRVPLAQARDKSSWIASGG